MTYKFTRMCKHARSLLVLTAALALPGAAVSYAQSAPPVLPDHTVYGRLGTGTGSGPGQAIPFTTLASQLGFSTGGTGFFFAPQAVVQRLNDRLFVADATLNNGTAVTIQPDWMTVFQLAVGRPFGSIEFSQMAVLQAAAAGGNAANAAFFGSQTLHVTAPGGDAIPITNIGINNNTSIVTGTYSLYGEAWRMLGAMGGAIGAEFDTINYASLVHINPFAQSIAESIGLQLASGAGAPGTLFAPSAAINIQANNSNWDKGINFGNDSIGGTNGTDGGIGQAITMATGHAIEYYYGAGTVSWILSAAIGVDGDYNFTSTGTGAVSVPILKEPTGAAWTTYTPTVSSGTGTITTSSAAGRYRQLGKTIFFTITVTITTNGSGATNVQATLPPFTTGAGAYVVAGKENNVSGKALTGFMGNGVTKVTITNYDNTYPGADGAGIVVSGVYERN